MLPPGVGGSFAPLQVRIFFRHMRPEVILPFNESLPVTYDVLRAEAAIFCQRDKAKVHMGSCLVHMHHCGQDRLRILPFFYKVACGPEEFPDLFTAFSFEEFRCRRDQNLYHADTVLPDPAPGFRHLPADLLIVSASRGYQVEVHI